MENLQLRAMPSRMTHEAEPDMTHESEPQMNS